METRLTSELKPNPRNPRGVVVVNDALRELAASIEAQGVLQPILITPDNLIVAGHRRHKACQLVKLRDVPVIVREMSELQQLEVMLVENLQRAELDVVQEGKAYLALEGHGLTLKEISKAIGVGLVTIKGRTAIASLPAECHEAFATKQIPVGCVEVLTPLAKEKQVYWVRRAVKEGWAGNKLCSMIRQSVSGKRSVFVPNPDETWRDNLSAIAERLERIDKELDDLNVRAVQVAVRQAQNLIVEAMVAKARAA